MGFNRIINVKVSIMMLKIILYGLLRWKDVSKVFINLRAYFSSREYEKMSYMSIKLKWLGKV